MVSYNKLAYREIKESYVYPLDKMLSELGGVACAYLGISMLSIASFYYKFIRRIRDKTEMDLLKRSIKKLNE